MYVYAYVCMYMYVCFTNRQTKDLTGSFCRHFHAFTYGVAAMLKGLQPRGRMNIGNAMEPNVAIGLEPKNLVIVAYETTRLDQT